MEAMIVTLYRTLFALTLLVAMTVTAEAAESDEVVRRLQSLAEAAPAAVDASPPFVAAPSKSIPEWYRRKVSIRDVAFDVRRTDSLVTPFAGEITFKCYFRFARAKSEDELKDRAYSPDVLAEQCKVNYAYQGKKWVRKDGYCSSASERNAPPRLMDRPQEGVGYYCVTLLPQE